MSKEYVINKLKQKHNPHELGYWEVRGEDPNCDFGGSHHQPFLGIVHGYYKQALEAAINMPRFWQWGAGGDIRPIKVRYLIKEELIDFVNKLMEGERHGNR